MQYGINIPQLFSTDRFDADMLRRYLAMVEDKGFHSAWVMERVVGTPPALDPLVLLSYAAANSSKIALGSSIIISVLRNPVILAKSLSSIDHLSEGRLIVGLAFGGFTQEPYYPAFGVAAKTAGSRFEEGVHIMKKLWTEERTTFKGRFWQLDDMEVTPKPLQKPHPPIWFGAHSPSAIKRAVRMGDGWTGSSILSTGRFAEELELLKGHLEAEGRDPGTFKMSKRVYMAVDNDKDRAGNHLRDYFGKMYGNPELGLEAGTYGSPGECTESLAELVHMGLDEIILDVVYDEMEQAQRLAEEVVPSLPA